MLLVKSEIRETDLRDKFYTYKFTCHVNALTYALHAWHPEYKYYVSDGPELDLEPL